MPNQYQYQNQPAFQSDPNLKGLLDTLVQRFQGAGNVPQYPDSQGAYNNFQNAARTRSADTTQNNINAVREQAAASGKTLSSAAAAGQARAASQGSNQLEELLARGGMDLQSLLTRQSEGRAGAADTRDDLATRLMSIMGGGGSGSGQQVPYEVQRKDQLQDELRRRAYAKEDQSRAQIRPGGGPAGVSNSAYTPDRGVAGSGSFNPYYDVGRQDRFSRQSAERDWLTEQFARRQAQQGNNAPLQERGALQRQFLGSANNPAAAANVIGGRGQDIMAMIQQAMQRR